MARDLDAYLRGETNNKQITNSIILKMFMLITGLRYLISSVVNNKSITIMMADANYLLGNSRLFSILYCMAAFLMLTIDLFLLVFELRHRFYVLNFLNDFKKNKLIPLSVRNGKKLVTIADIMSRYLMSQTFWPLVILTNTLCNGAVIMAYFDPNQGFHWYSVIAGTVSFFIFLISLYATVAAGVVFWTLPSFYLKYKFTEITEEIQLSIDLKDVNLLISAIKEHNSISVLTEELNQFFKYIIFLLNYFATPTLMILAYLTHAKGTVPFARLIAIFVFILIFSIVSAVSLFSSMISQSAEKPRKYLFKCFAERIFNKSITLQNRLKVMAFVEKLGEVDIGFYCWEVFPMNYYYFYKYVANCAIIYFLILGFMM